MSMYIGWTNKNPPRVFDAAQRSGAIVRDSHDLCANVEVNHVVHQIED